MFFKKYCLLGILISVFSACQMKSARSLKQENIAKPEQQISTVFPLNTASLPSQKNVQAIQSAKPEQFGIIFSGGGVRTWSYVSILKEMQKYKMPIVAVAGSEWGSVVAGIYAQNISANEVEWELSKFKSIDEWPTYVKKVFEKKSTQTLKIPFACSSLNLKNQITYVLNKGQLDSMIPFCVASPGISKPFSDSISSMSDLAGLSQFLKSSGATKIILISTLSARNGKYLNSSFDSIENQFWNQTAVNLNSALNKKNNGIDDTIEMDLSNINVEKFELRKDVLNNSVPNAKDQLKNIATKYNF